MSLELLLGLSLCEIGGGAGATVSSSRLSCSSCSSRALKCPSSPQAAVFPVPPRVKLTPIVPCLRSELQYTIEQEW